VVVVTHESDIAAWARRKLVFKDGLMLEDTERLAMATWQGGKSAGVVV
jgi:ABC-type lipoprotein export system ATPase subunit